MQTRTQSDLPFAPGLRFLEHCFAPSGPSLRFPVPIYPTPGIRRPYRTCQLRWPSHSRSVRSPEQDSRNLQQGRARGGRE